jgi:hypothetical protein
MSPEARDHSFDELARGLASGSISRGKAIRLMGAALLGGSLASLGVGGVALADEECKPTGKKLLLQSARSGLSRLKHLWLDAGYEGRGVDGGPSR